MHRSSRPPRRRVPVPRWAGLAAALLVAVETVGLVVRLVGAERTHPWWSMDAPASLPRSAVVALFCAAAATALTAGVRHAGRRTWWTAVAAVTGGVAAVKAGADVHVRAMALIDGYAHPVRGLAASAVVAAVVLTGLFVLSGGDRRDRRRILQWLGAYAFAAGGLSVGSALAGQVSAAAGTWATWVEESSEAVAAVGVLVSVLLGAAPRLVLPRDWVLRRSEDVVADAVVEAGERVSGRAGRPPSVC